MKISCPEFEYGGIIPDRFSQFHENRSLPLDFSDVPAGAQSLVLIMDDPDAPRGTFTHWVVFNIDGNSNGFRENHMPKDVMLGLNDSGEPSYAGPKPPDGEHRYFIHLYALDRRLDLPNGSTRAAVESAIDGHTIDEALLMGRYATPVMAR
jgi:Raf kinase inhibitor-like YbhB/YbcL family protein